MALLFSMLISSNMLLCNYKTIVMVVGMSVAKI